ncbi:MAG TPA: hypothetical protein VKE51_26805 [Vicinamibacterales bacterium]|nr:hypothetical protein [Vicinamibacterales bacterium]
MKNGADAAAQFQSILDHRGGENADAPLYPLAALGLARSERLAGRDDRARQAYEEFLAFWNDADPSLQPLIDARREVAVLQTPRQAPSAVVPRDER